ncbi:MAG: EVE domain-containing protein [Clostridia bacterium]|nr:EVE domain-containing protein [Clostridia bacterium]
MFEKSRLQDALVKYKQTFVSTQWGNEKYKWEAVKFFQDNWDVNATDFATMLALSLSKTYNLLASMNNFPAKMIEGFAKTAPEEVRAMFIALFDEDKDVVSRITEFKDQSAVLLEKYGNGAGQHYQYENAVSTYLWLRYPDKYYIYKYGEIKTAAEELRSDYRFKKGAYADNLRNFYSFYDELCAEISRDGALISLLKSQLSDDCYPDPQYRTLTIDVGFYISRYYSQKETEAVTDDWFPTDYTPNITVDKWVELLNDPDVFTTGSLEIMRRMKDYGGQATCTQLAIKYGETKNFYNSGSTALARRIAEKTGCPVMERDTENSRWWPILYVGRSAKKDDSGVYIWKLRDELSAAIDRVDMSEVALYADAAPAIWKISHGTENTGISDENKKIFLERSVIVVHSQTKAKATSKVSQGESFTYSMKMGDYFYLCYGNSIQLLGQITSSEAVESPELKDGWYERSYRVVAMPKINDAYEGTKKWWTPNDNSTCIKVDDKPLFEELILKPYFRMTVSQLLGDTSEQHGYWWLNANPKIWSFADLAVGEVQSYTLYNDNGNKRRIFQNFLDAKAGDMIIGYESNPVKQIVAIGKVSAEQDGERIYFEKVEGLSSPIDYSTLKSCSELERMEYFSNPQGSLFKLTKGEYDFIVDIIRDENPLLQEETTEKYDKADYLNEVYMTESRYDMLLSVLKNKKNIILQGAPGVGKTFAARRLAYSMIGEKDESRIEFVQFHQNYSYEDFMMGYKPVNDGFELKYGIFYRFCQKAANQPDKDFIFIIDEINRGNMSKIFGELLMLIERDYRGTKTTLAYNGLSFTVPKNLYIIGMMNTADRSLAMIDYALRRRFSFFEIEPGFDSEGFIKYQDSLNNETLNTLIERVKELNREIALDKSLGKGFCIGHSYFCGQTVCSDDWMYSIIDYDILPMLSEYWFDDSGKLQRWENILRGVFQ